MHREEKNVMKQKFIRNLNFIIRTIWKLNKKYVVFSMTRHCDHILLIENGKVCEMGNHTELIARQGMYARMWYAQSKKYKEGV